MPRTETALLHNLLSTRRDNLLARDGSNHLSGDGGTGFGYGAPPAFLKRTVHALCTQTC